MKDEIQSGLKNAIERGSTLEAAIQTFINAGYNPVEVREAAKDLIAGATSVLSSQTSSLNNTLKPIQNIPPTMPMSNMNQQNVNSVSLDKTKLSGLNASPPSPIQNNQIIPQIDSDSQKKTSWITAIVILLGITSLIILGILFKDSILNLLGK